MLCNNKKPSRGLNQLSKEKAHEQAIMCCNMTKGEVARDECAN